MEEMMKEEFLDGGAMVYHATDGVEPPR